MKSLAVSPYTASEVRDALHRSRTVDFRYDYFNNSNQFQGTLTNVAGGTVDHQAFADIKRTAKFRVKDDSSINWLGTRVKPYMRLLMEDEWIDFPLGLFLLSTPALASQEADVKFREIDAYDQTFILLNDKTTDRYTVAAGAVITATVSSILAGSGITLRNVVPSTLTMATARDWDPGTPKITVVNDLLRAINYQSIWFDSDGFAIAQPYVSPSSQAVGETYLDDRRSMLSPSGTRSLDLFSIPNRWVAYVSDPDRASLRSEFTNTSASSPTSTVNRGFTIVDYREANDVPDQATLDAYVARLADEASQVYEHAEVFTGLMPHHEHLDRLNIRYERLDMEADYQETGWSMELRAGGKMKHNLRRLVNA